MMRITIADERVERVTLKVEGRIGADWVELLERECRELLRQGKHLLLDFSAVTAIDDRGAHMLKRISSREVKILNCPSLLSIEAPDQ